MCHFLGTLEIAYLPPCNVNFSKINMIFLKILVLEFINKFSLLKSDLTLRQDFLFTKAFES